MLLRQLVVWERDGVLRGDAAPLSESFCSGRLQQYISHCAQLERRRGAQAPAKPLYHRY